MKSQLVNTLAAILLLLVAAVQAVPASASAGGDIADNSGKVSNGVDTASAPVMLVGHVTWQGRPAQPHALQQESVTLTLRKGATEINYPTQLTDASGYFTVTTSGLDRGDYQWRVKGPKFLANSGQFTLRGRPVVEMEMGMMRAGDANNDNLVNASDFNMLRNAFGAAPGNPAYDDRADFTGDHAINLADFNLLRANFGAAGAEPN